MSVLRAIFGRFARFLVRVARRLDPAITPAAAWTVTERMAALRQRYPGAPDHWLKLIAQRATIRAAAPPEPDEPPRAYANEPQFPVTDPAHADGPAVAPQRRPTARLRPVFFRGFDRRARPAIAAVAIGASERDAAPLPTADRRSDRPSIVFAPRRLRNPLARLFRLDRREPHLDLLHFETPDERRAADPLLPENREWIGREAHPIFPDPAVHAPARPAWAEPAEPPPHPTVDLRWPVLMRASAEPSWPDQPGRHRPDPRFAGTDPRWPDLPAIPDDPAPLLSARDEAALRAEQVGGTWSA